MKGRCHYQLQDDNLSRCYTGWHSLNSTPEQPDSNDCSYLTTSSYVKVDNVKYMPERTCFWCAYYNSGFPDTD